MALSRIDTGTQNQRVKEAIRAYKAIIALAKELKNRSHGKELAKTIVASVKNQVRNSINVLT